MWMPDYLKGIRRPWNEYETLPKKICDPCYRKLEMSWSFAESIAQAQNQIFSLFVEEKPILTSIEHVDDVNDTFMKDESFEINDVHEPNAAETPMNQSSQWKILSWSWKKRTSIEVMMMMMKWQPQISHMTFLMLALVNQHWLTDQNVKQSQCWKNIKPETAKTDQSRSRSRSRYTKTIKPKTSMQKIMVNQNQCRKKINRKKLFWKNTVDNWKNPAKNVASAIHAAKWSLVSTGSNFTWKLIRNLKNHTNVKHAENDSDKKIKVIQ